MNKHWRENVAQDKKFHIKSSFNQRQLYITKSDDSFIKDINEPIDYILDGLNHSNLINLRSLLPMMKKASLLPMVKVTELPIVKKASQKLFK